MAKVFRFSDRTQAEQEQHLVELRDGHNYRLRTGKNDQPAANIVRIHELADQVKTRINVEDVDALYAKAQNGHASSADTRLVYDCLVSLVRLFFFDDIPQEVMDQHTIDDLASIVDTYFLVWQPPTPGEKAEAMVASQI